MTAQLLCKHCGEPIAHASQEDRCAQRPPAWPPTSPLEARHRIRRWRYALERLIPRQAPQRVASEITYWLPRDHPQYADALVCAGKADTPREIVLALLQRIEASLPPDNTEARMGERIDRKFTFSGLCTEHHGAHHVGHFNALVFLARDRLLVPMLTFYRTLCISEGVDERQVQGIDLLIGRVVRYQEEHPDEVKLPDVEPGPAGDPVVAPNEPGPQLPGVPS